MIVVTGGAGFIGSNLVQALNEQGKSDILVVDNLTNAEKVVNLRGLDIADYMDKDEFYSAITEGPGPDSIEAILHQGACSDTMATDARYVMHNNFTYSKALYHFCRENSAQFIYASSASVYGAGSVFRESPEYESTLNAYAYSKLLFDNYVRRQPDPEMQCVGLRYFNVYGPREQHKERMASVAWHFRNQYQSTGKVKLFSATGGYSDGEQRRDFVSVEDVVAVNLFLLDNRAISGIFNVGTGCSHSFNEVAICVINSLRSIGGENTVSLSDAVNAGLIEYTPMPDALNGKYQSFTEADIELLRSCGYKADFLTVSRGVARYMEILDNRTDK